MGTLTMADWNRRNVPDKSRIGPAQVLLVLALSFAAAVLIHVMPEFWSQPAPPAGLAARTEVPKVARTEAEAPDTPMSVEPGEAGEAEVLIKNTLLALNQANHADDYAVFRDLATPDFRAANAAVSLSAKFAAWRKSRADFSVVMLKPVRLVDPPALKGGVMAVRGYFETKPKQLSFELEYVKSASGRWQLNAINLALF